jgi:hypothetical protein
MHLFIIFVKMFLINLNDITDGKNGNCLGKNEESDLGVFNW